ncbi:MAG: DUF624 domain-containing protein [Promicromonosporaceae bacterium]|nr:DUF624 domain-containing protein [Promicromonosporaceae bacterium]
MTIPDLDRPTPPPPADKTPKMFGDGPISVFSNGIYRFLMITLMMIAACLPTLLLLMWPAGIPEDAPPAIMMPALMVLFCIPLGPALSAGLYAMRAASTDEGLTPVRSFWRGYRLNWLAALKVWVPPLLLLAVIATTITHSELAGLGPMYIGTLTFVAALLLVWAHHALALTTFFTFRYSDVYRLAMYCLMTQWRATTGVLAIAVLLGLAVYNFPVLAAVLGGVWVWFWWRNIQKMLLHIQDRFTIPADTPASGS